MPQSYLQTYSTVGWQLHECRPSVNSTDGSSETQQYKKQLFNYSHKQISVDLLPPVGWVFHNRTGRSA